MTYMATFGCQADIVNEMEETILHTESKNGNTERVRFILREFASKNLLIKLSKRKQTALHLAAYNGHTEVAEILIHAARHLPPSSADYTDQVTSFQAFLRQTDKDMNTALHSAVTRGNMEVVKLIVEADPTDTHIRNNQGKTPVYIAAEQGYSKILEIICTTCIAPCLDGPGASTALHAVIKNNESHADNNTSLGLVRRHHGIKSIEVPVDHGIRVVEVLIGAAKLLSSSSRDKDNTYCQVSCFQALLRQGDDDLNTALHIAVMEDKVAIVKLLVEADPTDRHIQNNQGKTPMYIAAEKGYKDIADVIWTTCTAPSLGGRTALHAAILNEGFLSQERKDTRVMRMIIGPTRRSNVSEDVDESFAELFHKTDEYGRTILELAVERNHLKAVHLILNTNPAYGHGIGLNFIGLMPLIYKAINNDYKDIVRLLTNTYETGAKVTTLAYGAMATLISAIRNRKRDSVMSLLDDKDLVTFADNLGWTALHHAAYHEFDSIIYNIIEAQKSFGYQFVYEDRLSTPFHVAAEKGYTSTVILLMQLWPSSSSAYTAVNTYGQNILHLAALQSKKEMIQAILKYCPQEHKNEFVNRQDNNGNTPLHLLIQRGCFIPELMKYNGLDIMLKNKENWRARDMLYLEGQIIEDQVQIKITLDEVQINLKTDILESLLLPSKREIKDVKFNEAKIMLMDEEHARMKENLERYKKTRPLAHWVSDAFGGDANARAALEIESDVLNAEGESILHIESKKGDTERVQFILKEFANKNLLVKLDRLNQTALHLAAHHEHSGVVEVLVDAARHLSFFSASNDSVSSFEAFIRQATGQMGNTALHLAVLNGNVAIVKLLVEADPNDSHVQNSEGKTPIYIAAENGYKDIVKEICTTCTALSLDGPGGRMTALHAAIGNMHNDKEEERDAIRMMMNAAKLWSPEDSSFEALFHKTDESGRTILELAVHTNYVEVVELILQEDPAYQHGCGSNNIRFMHLIYTAMDKNYNDILKLLIQTYEAKVFDVHRGVMDLIVAIKRRERVSVIRLLGENKQLVTFVDEDGWTPLHHAAYYEFDSILGVIIQAQIDVGHEFVYNRKVSTPFHVAARKGYTLTVILLMELWPTWSSTYTEVDDEGKNILHLAAFENEKEMVQGILKCCPEKFKNQMVNKQDSNGNTPLHLLIKRGCFIPELIKYKGLDTMRKNQSDHTPLDYFYLEDGISADQVKIKLALDDIETDHWKFWRQNIKRKSNYLESVVLPSRRKAKDEKFEKAKKKLIDENHGQMKKDLERYKKRTNTQIIVTALITTVTFTVGFTMPGGLHRSGEMDQGLVVFSTNKAFNAFMVSDALALLLSTCSLFLYFLESMYEDPRQVSKLNAASTGLNIVSVVAMMLTFITGTYVVLSHSLALAITVCLIGSFFFIFVMVLLIKMVCDRQVKRNDD